MRLDPLQTAALDRARGALSVLASTDSAPRFSLLRAVRQLATGAKLTGADLEYQQELSHARGLRLESGRCFLPWQFFRRDLAVSGSAGVLVQTSQVLAEAIDLLRPWSVTARAGIQMIDQLQGNVSLPKTGIGSTGYWLGTEAVQITGSTPQLKQVNMTPKSAGGLCVISKQLLTQGRGEMYLQRELLRTLGTLIDNAVLNGDGTSGKPIGITRTDGIGTQSGTGLAYSGVLNMLAQVSDANAQDEAVAFLAAPQTRKLLQGRERATGSGFIWDRGEVAGCPAHASTDVAAATLICGAWPEILLGLWGDGFEFDINPNDPSGFRAGTAQLRAMVTCDVGVLNPTAFSVASSIT